MSESELKYSANFFTLPEFWILSLDGVVLLLPAAEVLTGELSVLVTGDSYSDNPVLESLSSELLESPGSGWPFSLKPLNDKLI